MVTGNILIPYSEEGDIYHHTAKAKMMHYDAGRFTVDHRVSVEADSTYQGNSREKVINPMVHKGLH